MKKESESEITFEVSQEFHGQRLDKVLSQQVEAQDLALSRSQLKQLIDNSRVEINLKIESKAGCILKVGDNVKCRLTVPTNNNLEAYDFPLKICYEDEELVVIDKPANLTVHPGANTGATTLLNALIFHYLNSKSGLPPVFKAISTSRGGIVHRLDKDTSGLMVVAKTLSTLQNLTNQFSERSIKRFYIALVFSTPRANRIISEGEEGLIELPIGRDPVKRVAMGVGGVGERQAATEWKVLDRFPYATLVELRLRTGRTHQIRVHMNAIGSPVIGDKTYGEFSGLPLSLQKLAEQFGRQALHAKSLGFVHPKSGQTLEFESEVPEDMQKIIKDFVNFTRLE